MQPDELGEGVRIAAVGSGELEVSSARLRLPWTPRCPTLVGSAVLWQSEVYEVAGHAAADGGETWRLRPWPDGEAVRGVFPLDRAWVQGLAAEDRQRRVASCRRRWTLPLAPLLALAPGRLQRHWESSWGFPAHGAMLASAVAELMAGAFLVIHALAAALGGAEAATGIPPWLLALGPLLWLEALLRLFAVLGRGEPMGSVVGMPLMLMSLPTTRAENESPTVHLLDVEAGTLDLLSPVRRADWRDDGSLLYRGDSYRLQASERLGRNWLYRFRRSPGRAGTALKLAPPPLPNPPPPRAATGQLSLLLRTALVSALACLAPADLQIRWARRLAAKPIWFTRLGALAELVGGAVNLHGASGSLGPLQGLDLYLVLEGVARLVLATAGGAPVGSIFGLALRPLLARMMSLSPPGTKAAK